MALVKGMNASYDHLAENIHQAIDDAVKDLQISKVKAPKVADDVLAVVADARKRSLQQTHFLMEHIMKQGKRGKQLEKHVQKELHAEVKKDDHRGPDPMATAR